MFCLEFEKFDLKLRFIVRQTSLLPTLILNNTFLFGITPVILRLEVRLNLHNSFYFAPIFLKDFAYTIEKVTYFS